MHGSVIFQQYASAGAPPFNTCGPPPVFPDPPNCAKFSDFYSFEQTEVTPYDLEATLRANAQSFALNGVQSFGSDSVQTLDYDSAPSLGHDDVQSFGHDSVQRLGHGDVQSFGYGDVHSFGHDGIQSFGIKSAQQQFGRATHGMCRDCSGPQPNCGCRRVNFHAQEVTTA
jgi:hypothetical protein